MEIKIFVCFSISQKLLFRAFSFCAKGKILIFSLADIEKHCKLR